MVQAHVLFRAIWQWVSTALGNANGNLQLLKSPEKNYPVFKMVCLFLLVCFTFQYVRNLLRESHSEQNIFVFPSFSTVEMNSMNKFQLLSQAYLSFHCISDLY